MKNEYRIAALSEPAIQPLLRFQYEALSSVHKDPQKEKDRTDCSQRQHAGFRDHLNGKQRGICVQVRPVSAWDSLQVMIVPYAPSGEAGFGV
jgi:hypothetical protein